MTVAAKESLPEQSAQSLQALHSLLVAAALSTKCARVSLVTPECACFASSDEELSRGRRYSPGENDITYDMRYEERLLGNLVFEPPKQSTTALWPPLLMW
ncbi:MAG: hypothetical protein ACJ78Q_20050 [Chloroflexia bacterium]